MAAKKLVSIRERSDGGGVPRGPAECAKCDAGMPTIDEIHHSDGSVCGIMARNYRVLDRVGLEPLGRYDPRKDLIASRS